MIQLISLVPDSRQSRLLPQQVQRAPFPALHREHDHANRRKRDHGAHDERAARPLLSRHHPMPYTEPPGNFAVSPRSLSMRSSWLYFATRSVRLALPVLIWPEFVATARSAMNVSSVSPLRCEMTD